jgi:cellulose synthase/poly-beta-1,6-N-acetylglucosamine synthase-like glycosyltransferase
MRGDLDRSLVTVSVLLICVSGTLVGAANGLLATGSRVAVYLLANLILLFDVIDLIARIWLTRVHCAAREGPSLDLGLPEISNVERTIALRPYALVASVRNAADDIDRFLATLRPFKDSVWLVDDASNDSTYLRLRRDGWNCVAGGVHRNKPGALHYLVKMLPLEIQTVVVLDPDVRWTLPADRVRPMLEEVISDLQRSGACALTPRVQARPYGWLVECQALEYELACGLGRKSLGDLTCNSGVSIYQRRALDSALSRHSLSIYAEDLENSLLLLASGQRIYYDDRMIVETEAKRTVTGLFSQRVGWAFGCAKLFLERLPLLAAIARRSPLGAYQYVVYLGLNGILLLPLKLLTIGILVMSLLRAVDDLLMLHLVPQFGWDNPLLFVLWYAKSSMVLVIACIAAIPRGERARHLLTLPFYGLYALLQHLPMTIGYLNVLSVKICGKRIYADHYDRNPRLQPLIRLTGRAA